MPRGRRSHIARWTARPNARAADSGYVNAATDECSRLNASGTPRAVITTASTGLVASPDAATTASATPSAFDTADGACRITSASSAGSASSTGTTWR